MINNGIKNRGVFAGVVLLLCISLVFSVVCKGYSDEDTEDVFPTIVSAIPLCDEPISVDMDPNNNVYPYSLMCTDWSSEIYAEGYTYYEIPKAYAEAGGMFPEVAQVYLWCICRDAGVDYYMVLALIERESGYKFDATGDRGRSKGLMQVQERYHLERMANFGAEDLYNPYSNMMVGVNYLAELQSKYLSRMGAHGVLMAYNMGEYGAGKRWAEGTYSTDYSTQIIERAQEIKQELQDK